MGQPQRGTNRMRWLIAASKRVFCNYLTQCARAHTGWSVRYIEVKYLSAASVSGQESCRVAIRSRAKVNTHRAPRTFPKTRSRRQSDGSSERATNFAKFTSQLLTSCGNSWADFMRNHVDAPYRVVRVFYILLLRENTTWVHSPP